MKSMSRRYSSFAAVIAVVFTVLACTESKPVADWTKSKRIAGHEQNLSHISCIAIDERFAYLVIGGTVADQNDGTNGLRKVALDTGAVSSLDDGARMPQSETGGLAIDEKFVYWNAGGNILRVSKDGGKPEVVAAENVGVGIDMAIDSDRVYWTNHGYYSPGAPMPPSPVYSVMKTGGKPSVFADQQNIPHNVAVDDKFVYWGTLTGIVKQPKSGGQPQTVFQATEKENVDDLVQEGDDLYFGFRGDGESRWALRKVSKSGGEAKTLVKAFSLKQLVVDEANVYFFGEDSIAKDAICKVPKDGGDTVKLDTGYASGAIAQSKSLVYFASLDDIFSISK
jgi:hypothetical protein